MTSLRLRPPLRHATAAALVTVIATWTVAPAVHAAVPGKGIVTDALEGPGGWVAGTLTDHLVSWVLEAVGFFVSGALDVLRNSSSPNVQAIWFAGPGSPYAAVRDLAVTLLAGFVLLGILQGLLHGDGPAMIRNIASRLPVAVVGMVATTSVAAYLLDLTDAASSAVLGSAGDQSLHFLSGFGVAVTTSGGGFAAVIIGLLAVLGGLLLWIELIVRSALVYLLVAISPIGFAAVMWPAARGFLRRTIEILLAVILSKFVIAVALSIGVAALAGAGAEAELAASVADGASLSAGTLLAGTVLLGVAAFAPFLVLRLIPVAETALLAQGISRVPARGAQSALGTYTSARTASRLSGQKGAGRHEAGDDDAEGGGTPADGSPRRPSGSGSTATAASTAATGGAAVLVHGTRKVAGAAASKVRRAAEPPVRQQADRRESS